MSNFIEDAEATILKLKNDFIPGKSFSTEITQEVIRLQSSSIDVLLETVVELKKEIEVLRRFRDAITERTNEL